MTEDELAIESAIVCDGIISNDKMTKAHHEAFMRDYRVGTEMGMKLFMEYADLIKYQVSINRLGRMKRGGIDPWFVKPTWDAINEKNSDKCSEIADAAGNRIREAREKLTPQQSLEIPAKEEGR
jgi:hypothetical protein